MIKFNLLVEKKKDIAILCFNMVDFNGFINKHSHVLRQIYGDNINFFLVNEYSDIINKKFLTYRTTMFFPNNINSNTLLTNIHQHIL